MLLAPPHRSTLADLLRLMACWLVAVLLVQGFAAAKFQTAGPLHHHRAPAQAGAAAAAALALWEHGHHHSADQRHHHPGADSSTLPSAEGAALDDALAAAAAALVAALAMLATVSALRTPGRPGRVWCAHTAWAALTAMPEPLLKPPQRA